MAPCLYIGQTKHGSLRVDCNLQMAHVGTSHNVLEEKTPNHQWVCKVVKAQRCLKLFEIDRGPTSWITSIIECFLLHQTLHVALTNQSVDMIVEHSEK
jgi:hypothetical protein